MNFEELCNERFSVRKFSDEAVADADLEYIMECVRLAPSAVNRQPWKFLIIKNQEIKSKVLEAYDRPWIKSAPVVVVALKDKSEEWHRPADDKPHGDIDLAIAVEHLCLAAADRGLGTCWVCNFDPQKLKENLLMPENMEAVALIPLGHIAEDCPNGGKKRKDVADIVEII